MAPPTARAPRTDIQGLRALAVGVVVAYHVAPESLRGGFVGVDVFFVISGFLITSHLLARPPRRAADFAAFWARRARRLLPASLLVLAVTVVATWLVGPETLWDATARQAGGATLYVVNWLLAADAVDYLAADDAATGVQHYWSLAVEEQFYLFWPLLVGALAWLARRTGVRPQLVWAVGLGAVAAASLAWSVHLTATDPGRAYFVTPTRIWELAAGGLVALALLDRDTSERSAGARILVGWLGLVAIVAAAVTYDSATPFPGWTAALPVLGAAAVIWARTPQRWYSPGGLLGLRPAQWLGDVSYSVYLWHWPLVVLVGVLSAPLGLLDAAGIVVLTLLLAAATTRWVEDPFRTAAWNVRTGRTYRWSAVGMAGVLVVCGALVLHVEQRQAAAEDRVRQALASDDPCLGAGALDPSLTCDEPTGEPVPSPVQAAEDKSEAYPQVGGRDCWSWKPAFKLVTCDFGEPGAAHDVVLFGNSHAGHLLPTLQEIGAERGWRTSTVLVSECATLDADLRLETPAQTRACRAWTDRAVTEVVERAPDLVVMSNRTGQPLVGDPHRAASIDGFVEGYERVLRRFADAGIRVVVVHDTPAPGDGGIDSVPDCLAASLPETDPCAGERSAWVALDPDPAVTAVQRIDAPGVVSVDVNDRICGPERCEPVVGGVTVYFDNSHLTATFARTLAPALDEAIARTGLMPGA
ncbi:acyltransferase family protein [Nocardioides daphniae]|nr:acyltransferase family protein [Nocardioides daphniae]GGD20832.1 acyltransferase [Nocardioides daphniae]